MTIEKKSSIFYQKPMYTAASPPDFTSLPEAAAATSTEHSLDKLKQV